MRASIGAVCFLFGEELESDHVFQISYLDPAFVFLIVLKNVNVHVVAYSERVLGNPHQCHICHTATCRC